MALKKECPEVHPLDWEGAVHLKDLCGAAGAMSEAQSRGDGNALEERACGAADPDGRGGGGGVEGPHEFGGGAGIGGGVCL